MNLRSQRLIPSAIALCSSYFDNILQIQVEIGNHLQFSDGAWALPFLHYIFINVLQIYICQAFTTNENCQCLAACKSKQTLTQSLFPCWHTKSLKIWHENFKQLLDTEYLQTPSCLDKKKKSWSVMYFPVFDALVCAWESTAVLFNTAFFYLLTHILNPQPKSLSGPLWPWC